MHKFDSVLCETVLKTYWTQ